MKLEDGSYICSDISRFLGESDEQPSRRDLTPEHKLDNLLRVGMLNSLKARNLRDRGLNVPLGAQRSDRRKAMESK